MHLTHRERFKVHETAYVVCVAVCCSVLQCVAVCYFSKVCSIMMNKSCHTVVLQCVAVCCSVLQCVAVCYFSKVCSAVKLYASVLTFEK